MYINGKPIFAKIHKKTDSDYSFACMNPDFAGLADEQDFTVRHSLLFFRML